MPFDNPAAEVELNDVTLLLIAGRRRIEKGWSQEVYRDGLSYCALGAISVDSGPNEELQDSCIKLLHKFIPYADKSIFYTTTSREQQVVIYNDDSNREQSDILDLFDRAIAYSMNCG